MTRHVGGGAEREGLGRALLGQDAGRGSGTRLKRTDAQGCEERGERGGGARRSDRPPHLGALPQNFFFWDGTGVRVV